MVSLYRLFVILRVGENNFIIKKKITIITKNDINKASTLLARLFLYIYLCNFSMEVFVFILYYNKFLMIIIIIVIIIRYSCD